MSAGLTFGTAAAAIATASLVGGASAASAQDTTAQPIYEQKAEQRVQFGVRAGLGIANISTSGPDYGYGYGYGYDDDTDPKLSGFITGAARIPITGGLAIAPEFGFTQMGYTYGYEDVQVSLNLNYLVAPILVEYAFELGTFAPYLTAGPQLAFKVGAKVKYEGPSGTISEDLSEEVSPVDVGIAAGLGARFHAGPVDAEAFFRFYQGFVNVDDADEFTIRNRQFVLGGGVLF